VASGIEGGIASSIEGVLVAAAPASTPILLAAMGGLVNRQGGIVNIGLEAKMLVGAFVAVVVSGATGSSGAGVLAAAAAGGVTGLLFSWALTRLGANEIIAGLGLNLFVTGLFGYLLPVVFGASGTLHPIGLQGLPQLSIPLVDGIPFVGPIVSGHDPLTYLSWLSVPVVWFFLYRTTWGMALRASGADEEAARVAGIPTLRLRDISTVIAGVMSGLAGAQLSLGLVQLFTNRMTAGRGFIAFAAYYFGHASPGLTALASILFGVFEATSLRLQSSGFPPQLVQMIPYLAVVASVTLVGVRRVFAARSTALGEPR
jgi:general nucleoside transport system permease protein